MFLSNTFTLIQMINKKNICFIIDIINLLKKDDENFSLWNMIKALLNAAKGEKIVKFGDQFVINSFLPPIPSPAFMNNMLAAREKTKIFSQQMMAQRSGPISIFISITDRCQYNCLHCSAHNRKVDEELTTEKWIEVIKDLQDIGTSIIGFTGGEPLLRHDLEEIINAIDERTTPLLFTNGADLTLERANSLKASGLFGVAISLDSYSQEKHNAIRRNKEAFNKAIKAIQNTHKAGLYTMINSLVLRKNIDNNELFKLFRLAKKLGVHEIRLLEPIKSGCFLDEEDAEIFYTQEDREKLIKIQFAANSRFDMPKITTFAYTESFEQYGCGAGTQHSYITADGKLFPCDFVPLSFGNVKDKNIKILWQEMNKAIGIPKKGCFAFTINDHLKKYENDLPLPPEASRKIAKENQGKEFPKFYRLMQGDKK